MKKLKVLGLVLGMLVILLPAGYGTYNHFAKAWQVMEVAERQDKRDLYEVRRDIFDLENKESQRKLTDYEKRRLQELRHQEEDIKEDIGKRKK